MNNNTNDSDHYSPNERQEIFNEPFVMVEKSQSEIREMIKNYRLSMVDKLLNLWHERYMSQSTDKDMNMAIAQLVMELQNLDIILRLTEPKEDKDKFGGTY